MKDIQIADYTIGGNNKEELEAVQNKINADTQKFVDAQSPEIMEKMAKVKQAAEILDAAKIPFVLLTSINNGIFQYNRLSYTGERFSPEDMFESRENTIRFLRWFAAIYTNMFNNVVGFISPDGLVFEYIAGGKVYRSDPGLVKDEAPKTE